jgi:hypothetical protein
MVVESVAVEEEGFSVFSVCCDCHHIFHFRSLRLFLSPTWSVKLRDRWKDTKPLLPNHGHFELHDRRHGGFSQPEHHGFNFYVSYGGLEKRYNFITD